MPAAARPRGEFTAKALRARFPMAIDAPRSPADHAPMSFYFNPNIPRWLPPLVILLSLAFSAESAISTWRAFSSGGRLLGAFGWLSLLVLSLAGGCVGLLLASLRSAAGRK